MWTAMLIVTFGSLAAIVLVDFFWWVCKPFAVGIACEKEEVE